LLGRAEDSLCGDVETRLLNNGFKARIIPDVFQSSTKSQLRLGSAETSFCLELGRDASLSDAGLDGVLITGTPRDFGHQSSQWDAKHFVEMEATSLGWIWGLRCPVINRYRPEFWFGRPSSIEAWKGQLEPFGLEPSASGEAGCDQNESGASKPDGHLAAVIGHRVIWNAGAPESFRCVSEALARFTESLGLDYVEYRLEDSPESPLVRDVELFPKYGDFSQSARREIVTELVNLLTSGQKNAVQRTASDSWF
jgi:hypothetical protein